jgi:ABC-type sulfate/molybdate transport systems ATPase subunit
MRLSGTGKTSLLRLIAGLLAVAGGSIALEGGESELLDVDQLWRNAFMVIVCRDRDR